MKVNKVHAAVVAALTGTSGLTYQTASAQEGLEEIVVTATRREQNLQEVPVSIVAITGENLETRGIDNLEEVSQGVPNVVITGGTGGTGGTSFRMRGIPKVGTYIDGIWQVGVCRLPDAGVRRHRPRRSATRPARHDVRPRLDGWRHPHLDEASDRRIRRRHFRRNGLERPTRRQGVAQSAVRRQRAREVTGANLFRDGYITSLTTGQKGGAIDQQVLRGDIVWDATDKVDFRFNYHSDKSTFTEPRVMDAMFNTFQEPHPNYVKNLIGLPEFYTYVGVDHRGAAVEPLYVPASQVSGFPGGRVGEWENRSGNTLPNKYNTEQLSVETNWAISDNLNVQLLTAQTEHDADSVIEWDNTQYDLVLDMNRRRLDVFSQEFQLTGGRERFEWLAGAYYWKQKETNRNGRWQVNEFALGEMNPLTVFAHPPATRPERRSSQLRRQPTIRITCASCRARRVRTAFSTAATRPTSPGRPASRSSIRRRHRTRCPARARTAGHCSAKRRSI